MLNEIGEEKWVRVLKQIVGELREWACSKLFIKFDFSEFLSLRMVKFDCLLSLEIVDQNVHSL